jgi:rhodanese-related sulfurtransferase
MSHEPHPNEVEHIEPRHAMAMVRDGAFLLDVRQPHEWDAGHAPDATLLPLSELATRIDEIPANQPIVVICRSGGRSTKAAEALTAAGYQAVNLAGGMQAWEAEGLPCVTDDGNPGTVA